MSIGPYITAFTAIAVFAAGVWLLIRSRTRKKQQRQTHSPHSPGPGYDRAEAIRQGVMGDNGHDR
ncbi:hypothetical protein [Roseobacter sp. SK209-2-6]|uniref:hypothetical protein n=1 Tax=Roseobacter sp. SK209-2-6 TaxID=388739 RepID=UPI0012F4EA13|nr:hypothetical protein [Roseobacter sp. SK209-2-6]